MLFIRFFTTLICIGILHIHCVCGYGIDIWTKWFTNNPFLQFAIMIRCVYAVFHMFNFIVIIIYFLLRKIMCSYLHLSWTNDVAMHQKISHKYVIYNLKCRYSQMKIFWNVSMQMISYINMYMHHNCAKGLSKFTYLLSCTCNLVLLHVYVLTVCSKVVYSQHNKHRKLQNRPLVILESCMLVCKKKNIITSWFMNDLTWIVHNLLYLRMSKKSAQVYVNLKHTIHC